MTTRNTLTTGLFASCKILSWILFILGLKRIQYNEVYEVKKCVQATPIRVLKSRVLPRTVIRILTEITKQITNTLKYFYANTIKVYSLSKISQFGLYFTEQHSSKFNVN
jgi:hypothetical protein